MLGKDFLWIPDERKPDEQVSIGIIVSVHPQRKEITARIDAGREGLIQNALASDEFKDILRVL